MSPAERKRRSRARQDATDRKHFQLQVQGLHLQYIEALALQQQVSTSAALRRILEPALDRYVGVVRRCDAMLANGATDDEVAQFWRMHWMPELPIMPE